jgi:hypothetical protein
VNAHSTDKEPQASGGFKWIIQIAGLIICLLWSGYAIFEKLTVPDEYASIAGIILPLSLALLIALNLFQKSSHSIVTASLGSQEYIQISTPEIEQRIRSRYQSQLAQLQAAGFYHIFDFGQTFSLVRLFLILPATMAALMLFNREVLSIKNGKFMIAHPVFAASDQSTLAHTFGLGTKFYTAFDDGTVLVSKSFKDRLPDTPGTLKHGKGGSISATWAAHQERTRQLLTEGKFIIRRTDFDFYTEMLSKG